MLVKSSQEVQTVGQQGRSESGGNFVIRHLSFVKREEVATLHTTISLLAPLTVDD